MASDLQRIRALLQCSDPVKWLFAGDSIAQGALHTMGWRDFTELFAERVRWELARYRDCVINTAVSGWRVNTLFDDLQWSTLQHHPQVVFIHIGMNDCAQGPSALPGFKATFSRLIETLRKSETSPAIVIQTPPRILPSDTLRTPHLADYAAALRELAAQHGTVLVDHFAAWESAQSDGTIAYWLSDPCHPNECGHRAMAHQIFKELGIFDPASRTCRLFVP